MPSEGVSVDSAHGDIGSAHDGLSNDELRSRLVEYELRVLELRDQLIGAEAARRELETRLDQRLLESDYRVNSREFRLEQQIADLNEHVTNHLAHIARLEEALASLEEALASTVTANKKLAARSDELGMVHASTTWRIARMLMLPRRIWLRLFGRR